MCVHNRVQMAACVCAGAHAHMCTCIKSRGHPEVSLSGMLSTSLATGSAVSLELAKHTLLTGQEALDPFASFSLVLGLQGRATTPGFFTWVLGIQRRSSSFTH